MSDGGFYPLRAVAALYCECDHHVHIHKANDAGVMVCMGVDGFGQPCKCPGFRPQKPKEPER